MTIAWLFGLVAVLLMLIAASIGVMTVRIAFRQHHYVFVPCPRSPAVTPANCGLAYEQVLIPTRDGERLHAWFVPSPADTPLPANTVLFCHGNAGNIGDRTEVLAAFHALGLATLIFDYRGYGQSTGCPSEKGTYADVLACWTHLTDARSVPHQRVIVYGHSLGGAVASWLASHVSPGALVMESVFSSVPDMAALTFPYLPVRWFCRIQYNNLLHVAQVRVPVLMAHSRTDEVCPFEQGLRVYNTVQAPKRFIEITGTHNDSGLVSNPFYRQEFQKFMRHWM